MKQNMTTDQKKHLMVNRLRGYCPIVVDVETGGLDPENSALLDIAALSLSLDDDGKMVIDDSFEVSCIPDEHCTIVPEALKINKINLEEHALKAINEQKAIRQFFQFARKTIKKHNCQRGILVGHNANFDLSFITAAAARHGVKRNPFHPFSVMDTVTLSGLVYGQTVLKVAAKKAGIPFDDSKAHCAMYDTRVTAELFCKIHNDYEWQV